MICYRIAPLKHNDSHNALVGLGGMFAEGRWHFTGNPIVYCASSRSLAMLERLVNDSTDILSVNLSVTTILIPDDIKIDRLVASQLPKSWDSYPYITHTQKIGTDWIKSLSSAVLQVPSSLCPEEYNYLVNPQHFDAKLIKCVNVSDFSYPNRISSKLIIPNRK